MTLETRGDKIGHSNRVFSVKYDKNDQNMLLSGGWDNSMILWDLRSSRAVDYMFGPHVCGDSIDISDKEILAGSYSNKENLTIWDLGTRKMIQTIDWFDGEFEKVDHQN